MAKLGFLSTCNHVTTLPARNDPNAFDGGGITSSYPASLKDLHWLERMVQAFISCVTTGNVKVLSCIVVFLLTLISTWCKHMIIFNVSLAIFCFLL